MKNSEREFKLNIYLVVIFGIIFLGAIVSIFFNDRLSYLLHLKPNTSDIVANSLEVHFLDTGEGDAILVRLPNDKTMIVDSGTVSHRGDIITYIDKVFFADDDKEFDYAILTHSDVDHSGNFRYLLDNYKIHNFYRPRIFSKSLDTEYSSQDMVIDDEHYDAIISRLKELESNNDINILYSTMGAETSDIEDYVSFLAPIKDYYSEENMYSPMIKLEYQGRSILLTGDATIDNEIELINTYDNIDIDVLKLAHHGSDTSTSSEFLEYITPQYAIISYGENNNGHPSSRVMDNIESYSSLLYNNIYTTYKDGNIICHISDNEIKFTTIEDVNSYIFVDYYFIAIGIMGICLIVVFFPRYKKDKK